MDGLAKLLWLCLAGALGTLARHGLSAAVARTVGTAFPWGTLAVNALGCFLFGVVWSLGEDRLLMRGETRVIILVGFMGAFTTFSTFAFETGQMLRNSEWLLAGGNLLAQNVVGTAALLAGMMVWRWM